MNTFFPVDLVAAVILKDAGSQDISDTAVRHLAKRLDKFRTQAYVLALTQAKEEYQKLHSGGCRMPSQGDICECFLCRMDKLRAEAEE